MFNVVVTQEQNYGLVASSRNVAQGLGKRHDHVVRDLENTLNIKQGKEKLTNPNLGALIIPSNYKDKKGELRKEYLLTKDGFILYMFNIQGYLDFKLAYIQKFNEMEQILRNKASSGWFITRKEGKMIRRKETDVIQELIFYAVEQGSKNANMLYITYSRLVNKLVGIEGNSKDKADHKTLINIRQLEDLFTSIIKDGMNNKISYKEIYQICKARGQEFMRFVNYDSKLLKI